MASKRHGKKSIEKTTRRTKNKKEKGEDRVEQVALDIAINVARKGEGCLLVLGGLKEGRDYKCHFPNFFKRNKVSVFEPGMKEVLSKLACVDGAVIIDPSGRVKAYGARILNTKTEKGYGTRHSAAKGASERGAIAVLASEQDKVVRIYKEGKKIMEINPFTKNIEKNISKIIRFLDSPEAAGLLAGAAAIPFVGAPGVIVFAGSYLVSKKALEMIKKIEF
ncbi:diadenylate cyclase [Candidatus Micrarchaeota archaeon]|nr:diadenylate cyclase [Candidatus Micrarchaeota archaeon]